MTIFVRFRVYHVQTLSQTLPHLFSLKVAHITSNIYPQSDA
jgi:hypothetical protein